MAQPAQKKTTEQLPNTAQPKRFRRPAHLVTKQSTEKPQSEVQTVTTDRLAEEPSSTAVSVSPRNVSISHHSKPLSARGFTLLLFIALCGINFLLYWSLHATPKTTPLPLDITSSNERIYSPRVIEYRSPSRQ